ncbi:hypothetical protein T484DRAFT_1645079 [Baffinella frigidus]|nr:hypothetical protein T484DRAFT_1645079 [Cryptophyta sp. CCMP2293]
MSREGSNYATDCICEPGYVDDNNGGGQQCEIGTWCHDTVKHQCPGFTSSPAGSNSRSNCTCIAGYTGADGAACVGCTAGTYKNAPGSASCTACAVDTFSATVAAETCSNCPTNTWSASGSNHLTNCNCLAGHTGNDGTPCASCTMGTYKNDTGDGSCISCSGGMYSGALGATSADTCVNCPPNTVSETGSYEITQCECAVGYEGNYRVGCTRMTVITLFVSLGMSVAEFDQAMQVVFVKAVSVALGIDTAFVEIVSILPNVVAAPRRLLSESIIVEIAATVSRNDETSTHNRVSQETLQSAMDDVGIPLMSARFPYTPRKITGMEQRLVSWMHRCPC